MIVVTFAKAVPLLVETPSERVVELEMVVIWEEMVSLPWKLPKNERRVPSTADAGIFHLYPPYLMYGAPVEPCGTST